ncbi:MAG TPA: hypothetical protein VEX15_23235 [Nocardioidaceae bacterium]|nr:hypothetical protein [Nocardioidaceae bacterium]
MKIRSMALPLGAAALLTPTGLTVAATGGAFAADPQPACHAEGATIVGTDHRDHLVGTAGRDVIVANAGSDVIEGKGGNDLVCAGKGGDKILGGTGKDRLFGGADTVRWDEPPEWIGDTFIGGPGNDYFDGGEFEAKDIADYKGADFRIVADLRAGTVKSGGDTDRLANGSIESVMGSAHNDRVLGSHENNSLTGGLATTTSSVAAAATACLATSSTPRRAATTR